MDGLATSLLGDRYYGGFLTLGVAIAIVAIFYQRRSLREATAAKLPASLSLNGASFYSTIDPISSVDTGTLNACEYVLFDHEHTDSEVSYCQTVLAIKTASPVSPTTDLSRVSGLRFERVGEWVFVFEPRHTVEVSKRDNFVRDCFDLLEYSQGVHHGT